MYIVVGEPPVIPTCMCLRFFGHTDPVYFTFALILGLGPDHADRGPSVRKQL